MCHEPLHQYGIVALNVPIGPDSPTYDGDPWAEFVDIFQIKAGPL